MLRVYNPRDLLSRYERIVIYGGPGIGKSRLGLSLTPRFGEIVYYAADDSSKFLSSISMDKWDRIHVIEQDENDDPLVNFSEFCQHDWKSEFPNAGTVIVDTYTQVLMNAIQYSAKTGAVTNEPHYKIGDPTKGGHVLPNRGDYNGVQGLSRSYIDDIFKFQNQMHIIFIMHEDVKQVEGVDVTGGPSHPGRQMLSELPARFNTVIRLIRDSELQPGADAPENVVVAVTDHDGKFIAKCRTTDETQPNPLGRVVLDRNPINFWQKYDALYLAKPAA